MKSKTSTQRINYRQMVEDFLNDLRNDHRDFDQGDLIENFGADPIQLFNSWLAKAAEKKELEVNAFVLSTVDSDLQPSSRILYLKEVMDKKFIFYTNYASSKGKDLASNPKASMLFFWPSLQQQIRIEGTCDKVEGIISDAYFHSRPRGSQIGAWASQQSEHLDQRADLEQRVEEFALKYPNEVPRPPHWGGYQLNPTKIEFWQGRPSRLHDRIVYEIVDGKWSIHRINP